MEAQSTKPAEDETTKSGGTNLKFLSALGGKRIGKAVEHVNDDSIVYLVGRHVAIHNYVNPSHRFILKNSKTEEIVAFAVSSNRRYIALSESLVNGIMQVSVYNFNTASRVRTVQYEQSTKLQIVAINFSRDNKYLVSVTKLPDVMIHLWQLDTAQLLASAEPTDQITQITISPWAHWTICTTGHACCKMWRFVDKQLKCVNVQMGRGASNYHFTCHTWYDDDKFVVGTEEGDLLVVEHGEVRHTLASVLGDKRAVVCTSAVGRGILCGGADGYVSLYERTFDSTTQFVLFKRIRTPQRSTVFDLTISPNEENVVLCYENNTFSTLKLEEIDTLRDDDSLSCPPLPIGFHSNVVTSMDVCIQRPIVATSSVDGTIRVYNYVKRRVEVDFDAHEEVLSLALHPMGIRLIVGMRQCIRMYNILANDLHQCWETPTKPCFELKFSAGGQYFAAITNRVCVFNSYDFALLGSSSGSTTSKSLCWSKCDQVLYTAESSGTILMWTIEGFKKSEVEEIKKGSTFSCVRVDDTVQGVVALGTSRGNEYGFVEGELVIRTFCNVQDPRFARVGVYPKASKKSEKSKEAHSRTHTAEIAVSAVSQTIFVGTPTGHIYLYKWPLADVAEPFHKYEVHHGEVLFVTLSMDERYLFTVGEDNCMFIHDVDTILEGKAVTRKPFNFSVFDDVTYVQQGELEERSGRIAIERRKLEELERQKRQAIKTVETECLQEAGNVEADLIKKRNELQVQLVTAQKDLKDAQHALVENGRKMDELHRKGAEELERIHSKRREDATERYKHLEEETDQMHMRYENKIYKMTKEHEEEKKKLETAIKELEQKRVQEIAKLRKTHATDLSQLNEMVDQTILDYESMLDEIKETHKKSLSGVEEKINSATNSTISHKRKQEKLEKEIETIELKLQENSVLKEDKERELTRRKDQNEQIKVEMQQRNDAILAGERKISHLKQQTAELEKLRYVLTYKFNELKKEVTPKDKTISTLNTSVVQKDTQLERAGVESESLKKMLDEADVKLKAVVTDVAKQRIAIEDKERMISNLLRELTNIIADNLPPEEAKQKLKSVVDQNNIKFNNEYKEVARDKVNEYQRQGTYMESQVVLAKRQNVEVEDGLRDENRRKITENTLLVKEINDLRSFKKQLAAKTALAESQLKEARAILQRMTSVSPAELARQSQASRASLAKGGANGEGTSPAPARKGKIIRGCTRTLRDLTHLDSSKIAEVIAQVEKNEEEMNSQRVEIKRLQEFVQHLLDRAVKESKDAPNPKILLQFAEIRQHLAGASAMTPAPAPSGPFM